MKPINFPEANMIYGRGQPEYEELPTYVEPGPAGAAISIWELTDEDLESLRETNQLYVMQLTFNNRLQPISLSITSPFQHQQNGTERDQQRTEQSQGTDPSS